MTTFTDIKKDKYYKILWTGNHSMSLSFRKHKFTVKRNYIKYSFLVSVCGDEMRIEVEANELVELEILYSWVCQIRRFEYLFDGSFYIMCKCCLDEVDLTQIIGKSENAYFQMERGKHIIKLQFNDRDYKRHFVNWIKLEKNFHLINQMLLYASNTRGITADIRIAMLAECYEPFALELEKRGYITVQKVLPAKPITCSKCGYQHLNKNRSRKTLGSCLESVIRVYGKPVFSTEYRRKRSLVKHIVKTRNKIFHVKTNSKGALGGGQSGFYAIKLDWMYRYIILCLVTGNRQIMDYELEKNVLAFETTFPQLVYHI